MIVLNIFAWRATEPKDMKAAADPVGPDNDAAILALTKGRTVLACWGAHGSYKNREAAVVRMLKAAEGERKLVCLGTTKAGAPRHPLYLKRDAKPVAFGASA